MMPQFAEADTKTAKYENIARGAFLFFAGLAKKVLLADMFATWADQGYAHSGHLGFAAAWVTVLAYSFQIYFDFSGYTDMAIGAAQMFNIRLPINFNSPYKAVSIQDFWRRWHITLSNFLRDYIYIPLGGNRVGTYHVYFNVFVTFLIGGLWHGASWTFVVWGALHGAALVLYSRWKKTGRALPSSIAWLLTFVFVNITWVFFRAPSFAVAWSMLVSLTGLHGLGAGVGLKALGAILAALVFILFYKNTNKAADDFKPTLFALIGVYVLFLFSFYFLNDFSQFIYFNF